MAKWRKDSEAEAVSLLTSTESQSRPQPSSPVSSSPFSSVAFVVLTVTNFGSNHHRSLFLTLFPFNHRRRRHSRRFSAVRSPPGSAPPDELFKLNSGWISEPVA
ncbi:hypothetical protein PIB30_053924 [Stylosanthes scabra]|uniref:Uncharacterized protein n=1 Tax=Stylosanthes scabra TaxID=79078 RepID=A0ABU6RJI0_9FABA|nr:hypothetical protein [Stylosanthes scabra]